MRKKDLLKAIGKIDEKYLIEAQKRSEENKFLFESENVVMGVEVMNETSIWKKAVPTVAIAAAFILIVGAVIHVGTRDNFTQEAYNSSADNYNTDNKKFTNKLILSIDEQNSATAILSKNYENLTFDDGFIVEFPEIDSFETFTLTSKPGLSGQEAYDLFDAAVDKYFPDTFTEEEKKELYYATGTNTLGETISGNFEQNKEDFLKDNTAPFMLLTNEKGMLEMVGNGGIQIITGTSAFNLEENKQNSVGMYCAADENIVVEKVHIPQGGFESDMEYNLLDGNVKLTDAIVYTENMLINDFNEEIANPLLVPDVYDAWVVDMGNGVYGYHFTMTHTYNNIRFDAQPMIRAGSVSTNRSNECKEYSNFPAYAFTIEKNKLDSISLLGYKLAYDISNVQTHNSMITAEDAAEILSQSISGKAGLVIERAEFMYTPYCKDDDDSILTVDASWRFAGSNTNDGYRYLFYVNAVTGEFDYYKYS